MRIEICSSTTLSRQLTAIAASNGSQEDVLQLLGGYLNANALWADNKGRVWSQALSFENATTIPMKADGIFLEPRLFSDLQKLGDGTAYLPPLQLMQLVPGDTLLLYREGEAFNEADRELAEICLPMLVLMQVIALDKEQSRQEQEAQLVKSVMNTLSYTELEVVLRIFDILDGEEGILVAGKVADGLRVTRSVVVTALRKLESARIIETRSLGAKGTYIRVLNHLWLKELAKLKA